MDRFDLMPRGLCLGSVVAIGMLVSAIPAGAQTLQPLAGRWKLTGTISQPATAGAQAGRAGRGAQALRAARAARAGRGGQAAQSDSTPTTQTMLDQMLTVVVRGDTVIAVDSTSGSAAGVVVKPDTFVVNGKGRSFHPAGRGGALQARAGAQGARAAQAVQAAEGVRLTQQKPQGRGFMSTDSVSLILPNRAFTLRTGSQWSLSEDGTTLTIDTKTTGAQGGTLPIKRVFTRQPK